MSAQEGTDQDIGNVVVDQLAVGFFAQDNKRLAKRSEATAGTEWLYAHSAGADFVRRGDNVKNKKRLWPSREASPLQRRKAVPLPSRLVAGRPWRKPSAASALFPGFGLESGLESGPVSGGWVQVPISRDLLPIPGFGARFSRPVSNGPFLRFSQAGSANEH